MGPRVFIILFGLAASIGAWFYFAPGRDLASGFKAGSPERLVEEYRVRLVAALESRSAMNFSIAKNPAQFDCLFSVSGSCRGHGGNFQLYPLEDSASQPLTQLGYTTGIQISGVGCNGFPSANCPLRLESRWTPVCSGAACDNVRTLRVEVSVVYSDGTNSFSAREERLVQPEIRLTENVRCQREQGFYDGRQCIKNAGERMVASSTDRNGPERAAQEDGNYRPDPRDFPLQCPEYFQVDQEFYRVELIGPGKGRIRMPAINHCPAHDTFILGCVAISQSEDPYARNDQGKWQQSEAIMAPPCDADGNPVGQPVAPQ